MNPYREICSRYRDNFPKSCYVLPQGILLSLHWRKAADILSSHHPGKNKSYNLFHCYTMQKRSICRPDQQWYETWDPCVLTVHAADCCTEYRTWTTLLYLSVSNENLRLVTSDSPWRQACYLLRPTGNAETPISGVDYELVAFFFDSIVSRTFGSLHFEADTSIRQVTAWRRENTVLYFHLQHHNLISYTHSHWPRVGQL